MSSLFEKKGIVLVNPPSPVGATANREGAAGLGYLDRAPDGFYYPPQTLAYVAAALRQEGWLVRAIDAVAERLNLPNTLAAIRRGGETSIGVLVSYDTLAADIAFLQALKAEAPASTVIVFGPATRYVHEQIARQAQVEGILLGEPEKAFAAAYSRLTQAVDRPALLFAGALGISGYEEEGFLHDLDSLPYPAWDLLPYARYRFLTVASSRGCGDRCSYCPYVAAQGPRFRGRWPEMVVEELAWLVKQFRPGRMVFRDSVFAWDHDRVIQICEGILARRIDVHWECESRPEHFDEAMLRLMRRAGCEGIKIGVETISGPLLYRLQRLRNEEAAAHYREHIANLVRICKSMGLRCRVFLMIGLPGQDRNTLQETYEWVKQLRPVALNIKAFQAYPGIRMPAGEQAVALPPDEETMEAFQRLQQQCAGHHTTKRGVWQKARGWLRRPIREGNE